MKSDFQKKNNVRADDVVIFYQNVRGLTTKLRHPYIAITGEKYPIIVSTETWLHIGILSAYSFDSRYVVYRMDRVVLDGGVLFVEAEMIRNHCTCG